MQNKGKYNLKSIIVGLILIIIGSFLVYLDMMVVKTERSVLISIGCSLLASGLVILLQAWLVEAKHINYAEEWGLTKIYELRSEKSADSDPKLAKTKEQLDVVAFGLKSFRDRHKSDVVKIVRSGVNVRILTMNPADEKGFLSQRELEEGETSGGIKKSINDLIEWADKINEKNRGISSGSIIVKGYNCMTLDFYWRTDNELFIGPYWYGRSSQNTITYKFEKGKKGFDIYTKYFDDLWCDANNTVILTKPVKNNGKTRRINKQR